MSLDPTSALTASYLSLPELRPFSPTLIHYSPSLLNTLLVLLSLTPIFIFVAYLTLLIFTRQLSILFLAAGQLLNEALSLGVKRLLKGDRPYKGHEWVGTGYGMPSSHAQAGGYVLAWAVGYWASRLKRYPMVKMGPGLARVRRAREGVWLAGVALWSVLVAYSRWHLYYHTPIQILAGYNIGLAFGAAWYLVTEHLPLYYPQSLPGQARRTIEWMWESVGGVGGWHLGGAQGGWGEGRLLVPELRGRPAPHKAQKES